MKEKKERRETTGTAFQRPLPGLLTWGPQKSQCQHLCIHRSSIRGPLTYPPVPARPRQSFILLHRKERQLQGYVSAAANIRSIMASGMSITACNYDAKMFHNILCTVSRST